MSDTRVSRTLRAVPARVMIFGLAALATACVSAESKRMKALAGDYVQEYASDTVPGQEPMIQGTNTLTLRADGRYLYTQHVKTVGRPDDNFVDSGAYRINGTTLATSPTEAMPLMRYTISGDSLWAIVSGQIALTEKVTGVKMDGGGPQVPLVRRR